MNCETPNRWAIELGNGNSSSLTLEPLARLQGIPVSVRVHVPRVSGGEPAAGVTEDVTCVTTHATDPSLSATDSAVVTVNQLQAFSVDLYSSEGTPVGSSGNALDEAVSNDQELNLTLDVKNLGNVPITLSMQVTPERSDWPLGLFCGSQQHARSLQLELPAGGDIDCRIQVHVPANVADGDANEINVRTQLSMSNFIQNRTALIVEQRPDLILAPPESGLMQVDLGSSGYAEFSYTNIGNVPLLLEWEFGSVPEGWQVGFRTAPDDAVGMHRSDTLQISLELPAGTPAGIHSETVTLLVTGSTSEGVEVVRTATVGVEVGQSAWLFLSSDMTEFERLAEGEIRTGNLTVTNGGNVACMVDFSVDTPEGWSLTGLGTIQSLGAGQSKTYEYSLENAGATSASTLTILAIPSSGAEVTLTNSSVEIRVSSTSLASDGGLFSILDAAGVPGWVVGLSALVLLGVLVAGVLALRRTGEGIDAGEEIIGSGGGTLGSVEQRREAALDTGTLADDLVSGSVSEEEIAEAIAESSPGKLLAAPPPPGRAPPPTGLPPSLTNTPPPPDPTPVRKDGQ
jgi:tetrahydromethanopterin S-methyltransferase subunit F